MIVESVVSQEHAGQKLSTYLHHIMSISTSQIKSAKWDSRITVNGQSVYTSYVLKAGDTVHFLENNAVPCYPVSPMVLPLSIPYEDDQLLIVDKPARLATSSSARYPDDALENALFYALGEPKDYIFRPVNRLDKGTSGLMAVARNALIQYSLQSMLHTPDFIRTYLAITDGIPASSEGTISLPIAKAEGPTIRREIRSDGKPSITHYKVLAERNGLALVRLQLETGRTHQIRVHMAALGCPVFGDFLYGTESERLPGRFALHAAQIQLLHPVLRTTLNIESPLPDELKRLLD